MMNFAMFVVFCIVGVVAMFAIMTVVFWHIWDTKTRNQRFDSESEKIQKREDMRFQLEMMREFGVKPNTVLTSSNQHNQYDIASLLPVNNAIQIRRNG